MSVEDHPVSKVVWVPIEQVVANDYNPNSVATNEMALLHLSIKEDGYTQPVVTYREGDRYVIVDGFHRYLVMKRYRDISESTGGLLPVVVIEKDLKNRMASTVRHNRARGKHAISGMGSMVFRPLEEGWEDADICLQLGMTPDELVRLKHVSGFSKLFANIDYKRAWVTRQQLRKKKEFHEKAQGQEGPAR